jgi:hypothetical protein
MGLSIVVSPSSTDLFQASTMLSEDENLTHHATTVEAVLSGTGGPSDLRNSLYQHFFLYFNCINNQQIIIYERDPFCTF